MASRKPARPPKRQRKGDALAEDKIRARIESAAEKARKDHKLTDRPIGGLDSELGAVLPRRVASTRTETTHAA
jgi:hypothetical protein